MSWRKLFSFLFIVLLICTGCQSIDKDSPKPAEEAYTGENNSAVEDASIEDARQDLIRTMGIYKDLYKSADRGEYANVVLEDEMIKTIRDKLAESGLTVYTSVPYQNMCGADKMDRFLNQCGRGIPGKQVIYQVHYDGGLARDEYRFDGENMKLFSIISSWDESESPVIAQMEEFAVNEWFYSQKGYFGYQLDVPEPPEVTEIIDGSVLIRIAPLDEKYIGYSRKYAYPIGYAGNNLLSSDWDADKMKDLDYNGIFECFYRIEHGHEYGMPRTEDGDSSGLQDENSTPDGISQQEFEQLMMKYLPVGRDQIRKYAAYDKKSETYPWEALYCMNYTPTSFGTSLPEVVDARENPDKTLTLTIDAVCDHVLCDDRLITSELTVQINDKQEIRYLANHVISGKENIPEYRYRIGKHE